VQIGVAKQSATNAPPRSQRAPGVFAFVGAGNVACGITAAHHHPRFDIDEASLDVGLRYLVAATVELLGG
jgi:amidohydrolase